MAVIEMLRATCAPGRRAEWLARDAAIWTPALAAHDGFVLKEVWPSIDHPDEVVILVRWESLAQWKSFPDDLNRALDAQMQDVQVGISSEALEIYSG
ncbi:MAG: TIGR03792 family protein [Caldilinea sp.]|jgi:uncharacterized protein (TIGR03792 family)